jgi:uncharacterized phosphatase
MKFFFIRHGESLWNAQRLCQGQKDIELSQKGLSEAQAFAAKTAHLSIGHICTSPLKRALKTAQIIKEYHPSAGFSLVEEFAERSWGYLEGMSSEAMYEVEKQEEANQDLIIDPSIESRKNLKSRIKQGLDIAFQLHSKPLIVSHGRLFLGLCELLNIPMLRQINNLCLMEITKTSTGWRLQELNLDQ